MTTAADRDATRPTATFVDELRMAGQGGAAAWLVRNVDAHRISAWGQLYRSCVMFTPADAAGPLVNEGTYMKVREASPESCLRYPREVRGEMVHGWNGSTLPDSEEAGNVEEGFAILDATVRLMAADEEDYVCAPYAFTFGLWYGKVHLVMFMRQCVPLSEAKAVLARTRVDPAVLRAFAASLVRGVMAFPRSGIVWRDVKKDNVVVDLGWVLDGGEGDEDGSDIIKPVLKVRPADLGSCADVGTKDIPSWIMNPPWMSPEQLNASRPSKGVRAVPFGEDSAAFAVGLIILYAAQGGRTMWPEFPINLRRWQNEMAEAHRRYEGADGHARMLRDSKDATVKVALGLAHPSPVHRLSLADAFGRLTEAEAPSPTTHVIEASSDV